MRLFAKFHIYSRKLGVYWWNKYFFYLYTKMSSMGFHKYEIYIHLRNQPNFMNFWVTDLKSCVGRGRKTCGKEGLRLFKQYFSCTEEHNVKKVHQTQWSNKHIASLTSRTIWLPIRLTQNFKLKHFEICRVITELMQ